SDQRWLEVIAVADGHGVDWHVLREGQKGEGLTLRLAKGVPIRGRLLDLNGKPVAGAKVRLDHLRRYRGDDLSAFLKTVRDGEFRPRAVKGGAAARPGQPREVVTGADGRFRLDGLGAGWEVHMNFEGPGIETGHVRAVTLDLKAPAEPKETGRVNRPLIERVY